MIKDLFAIKGKLRVYKGHETKQIHFVLIWLGQPVREEKKGEKKRKKRKKRKKEKEKTKPRYVFILKSWVFWSPKVLGLEISSFLF